MSYTNNWAKELKESYIEEKKARQVVNEHVEGSRGPNPKIPVKKVNPPSGNVRRMADGIAERGREVLSGMGKDLRHAAGIPPAAGRALVKALRTRGGPDEAKHLGKGGMYDHVEHEGNSLQEEVALNEHLLMLIDVLCEELGIDVEALLENADPVGRFEMNQVDEMALTKNAFNKMLKGVKQARRMGNATSGDESALHWRDHEKKSDDLVNALRSPILHDIGPKGGLGQIDRLTGSEDPTRDLTSAAKFGTEVPNPVLRSARELAKLHGKFYVTHPLGNARTNVTNPLGNTAAVGGKTGQFVRQSNSVSNGFDQAPNAFPRVRIRKPRGNRS
jgi:hypothetical protein